MGTVIFKYIREHEAAMACGRNFPSHSHERWWMLESKPEMFALHFDGQVEQFRVVSFLFLFSRVHRLHVLAEQVYLICLRSPCVGRAPPGTPCSAWLAASYSNSDPLALCLAAIRALESLTGSNKVNLSPQRSASPCAGNDFQSLALCTSPSSTGDSNMQRQHRVQKQGGRAFQAHFGEANTN